MTVFVCVSDRDRRTNDEGENCLDTRFDCEREVARKEAKRRPWSVTRKGGRGEGGGREMIEKRGVAVIRVF